MKKKVENSIKFLQAVSKAKNGEVMELCYSGGKDSDIILALCRMAKIPFIAIYKNTTIDPKGTLEHTRKNGVYIWQPKKSFFQIVREKGVPTRQRRFCCEILKEYKILNTQILGIRIAEGKKRKKLYKELTQCRVYKTGRAEQILPILYWTNKDVEEFIKEYSIQCHPLYYTDGKFDVNKRLGCIGCPLQNRKKRIEEFKNNPKMLRAWIKSDELFLKNRNNNMTAEERMFYHLYTKNIYEFREINRNLFNDKLDCKSFLEKEFRVNL